MGRDDLKILIYSTAAYWCVANPRSGWAGLITQRYFNFF